MSNFKLAMKLKLYHFILIILPFYKISDPQFTLVVQALVDDEADAATTIKPFSPKQVEVD
jgi:hypothetical protein